MAVSSLVAFAGIGLATFLWLKNKQIPERMAQQYSGLHKLLLNKYYVDEIYQAVFVDTCLMFATFCHAIWDVVVIDGIVNGAGTSAKTVAGWVYRNVDQKLVDGAVNGSGNAAQAAGGQTLCADGVRC